MKNILIFGGTGAMGTPLVKLLSDNADYDIWVTSRSEHQDFKNVRYLCGNAQNDDFFKELLKRENWDVIVDFMVYDTPKFEKRYIELLKHCKQYLYISSCRVYAQSEELITENTRRLLDVSTDKKFLSTDEYALTKARQENLLLASNFNNYTIVRPSITYNSHRLQLGVLEKEHWLYRALQGRTIVFSKDMSEKLTTMTLGTDVAKGICGLIGKETALGDIFHITSPKSCKWSDVLNVYLDIIEELTGKKPKVMFTDKSTCFKVKWNIYQLIYCRYYNRAFDNSKIAQYVDINSFEDIEEGIRC